MNSIEAKASQHCSRCRDKEKKMEHVILQYTLILPAKGTSIKRSNKCVEKNDINSAVTS